ncbi:MAG: glycosyltransferase family 4 protein [Candidatus Nanohaloarchaea archaeon]
MGELEKITDVKKISPSEILKPWFLNKLLLNPLKFWSMRGEKVHVTNQDDLATFLPLPKMDLSVTVHDIFPYAEDYSGPVYSLMARLYVRNLERHADRIIAISEATKEQLLENTAIEEDRIEVVYQGVDTEIFRPVEEEPEYDNYFLHVGSEIERKNIPGLIQIFEKIKEERHEALLVRVGRMSSDTEELIEDSSLKIGEDIVYVDSVDTEELVKLYSHAEKLLFPSHGEGFGRPMIESLACGTPVVAYNRKPMSEVLPEDMLVQDKEFFVKNSLKDSDEIRRCRSLGENFGWEETAKSILEVV